MNFRALLFFGILSTSCAKNENKSTVIYSRDDKLAVVYTTASNTTQRLEVTDTKTFKKLSQAMEHEVSVFVNPKKSFQSFIGIGGAITDASAEVFAKLPEEKQEEILSAYYDPNKGIGYSLLRTPIHSADFSSETFTYVSDELKALTSFSIDHDKKYRIPLIKRALKAAGGSLLTYASPWSPPAFMKDSKNMLNGGKLLPDYYESWALY
jgi:glucosylceramidase